MPKKFKKLSKKTLEGIFPKEDKNDKRSKKNEGKKGIGQGTTGEGPGKDSKKDPIESGE